MSRQKIIQDPVAQTDEHTDQSLNIDVVVKKFGYSKWYLQRMFRTVTHQTFDDYIRQRRLLLVAVELRITECPIFDITMDLGYVLQRTFSRVLRRQFDCIPSDYRHRLQFYCLRVSSRAGNRSIRCINTCGGIAFAKNHPWR